MIKKLRYKFIVVTMTCISLLFILILCVINLSMTITSRRQGYDMLRRISEAPIHNEDAEAFKGRMAQENDPTPPEAPQENDSDSKSGGGPFPSRGRRPDSYQDALRVFSITYDAQGNVSRVDFNEKSDLTEDDILLLGEKVLARQNSTFAERGAVSSRYLYLVRAQDSLTRIFFLDYTVERTMTFRLFYLCLAAGLAGILVLFIAVFFLSRWMVRPVQNAFDKQKQFIADASHELKTPLTIITANAEVLSSTLGENKWLFHVLDQSRRMNLLIRDLLELARMDVYEKAVDRLPFDLSKAVSASALSFESLAFETHKTYKMEIRDGIQMTGSEQSIRQLVTILLDNAFKYSDEKGAVLLSLSLKGESKSDRTVSAPPPLKIRGLARFMRHAHFAQQKNTFHSGKHIFLYGKKQNFLSYKKILSVRNTGAGIAAEDLKHIFERFYRSDSSRSRESGGYGLGLSIAASIVSAHHGHISAKSDGETWTQITVTLP